MENPKKVLQLIFTTKEGGSLRISVADTRDDLTSTEIAQAMDAIVAANIFDTKKGEVTAKVKARYVTQTIEEVAL